MSMMLKQRMEAMKEIIEADTDPMKEVLNHQTSLKVLLNKS